MQLMFNKITLYSLTFLSFCLIVIGIILRAIFFPIQDIDLVNSKELLELQKEYAISYPIGTGLLYLGMFLIIAVIVLFITKLIRSKR